MRKVLMSLGALLALTASVSLAQQSQQRAPSGGDGLWIAGGLGSGWARVACEICQTDRGTDFSGFLGVGGRLNRRMMIGAEASGWLHSEGNINESMWGVSAVAYWHPVNRRGFMWKAGIGLMQYKNADDQDALTSTAIGFQVGTSYVIPVTQRLAAVPYLNLSLAPFGGEVKFNSATILDRASLSLVQVGIGVLRR